MQHFIVTIHACSIFGCKLIPLTRWLRFILCGVLLVSPVFADGHGPAFGYSTTILGVGDSSLETSLMWRSGMAMIAPKFTYGWKENLQVSISAPFDLNHGEHPVGRFQATMPGNPEVEGLLAWRFHHKLTGVGTRNESTIYFGGSALTQAPPRTDGPPLERQPGIYGAIATAHISRRYYFSGGAGYQHYGTWSSGKLDHQSDTFLSSVVIGWRPPFLDRDYPKPDLRFFWETTGDQIGRAWRDASDNIPAGGPVGHDHEALIRQSASGTSDVIVLPNSGGRGIYSGPSFLYTYRSMAFQTGILFALWEQRNGTQPDEKFRATVGISYFFWGRR